MKKFLSATLIVATLFVNAPLVFARQNYVYTNSTTENYSASSPVGSFSNYSNNGNGIPVTQYYVPNYSTVAMTTPYGVTYTQPVYNTGIVNYTDSNSNYNQTYNSQNINVPQSYTRTVTNNEQYIDTREKADKVIDRGVKVLGALAVVGAIAGIVVGACCSGSKNDHRPDDHHGDHGGHGGEPRH